METKFQPTNETPLAALTIGQFKELIVTMVQPQQIIHSQKEKQELLKSRKSRSDTERDFLESET